MNLWTTIEAIAEQLLSFVGDLWLQSTSISIY